MFFPKPPPPGHSPSDASPLLYDKPPFPQTPVMATIGPASFRLPKPDTGTPKIDKLKAMVEAGMNMLRINLAHVSNEDDKNWVRSVLRAAADAAQHTSEPLAITVDLGGPKIRIANVRTRGPQGDLNYVDFHAGDECTLTSHPRFGVATDTYGEKNTKFSLKTDGISLSTKRIKPGQDVSMDDGCFRLKVTHVYTEADFVYIVCQAKNGWTLYKDKGVNFPGCHITDSALTQKDYRDLEWLFDKQDGPGREGCIDYVSLSFVKSRRDIQSLRDFLDGRCDARAVRIIAKIETAEAAEEDNDYGVFRDILEVADGIMVARGDLGAEMPFENVPEIQRILIEKAHGARKPVIVATQMLENMVRHEFATRAEVTDVANAILEGADVTMLSAETSKGCDPVGAVRTMKTIARRALERVSPRPVEMERSPDQPVAAIAHPAVEYAAKLGAKVIVSFTHSGDTPIAIAHYWPRQPVVAITWNEDTMVRLRPYRGIYAILINYVPKDSDEHRAVCARILRDCGLTRPGDLAVVTLSMEPVAVQERETNALYLFRHEES